MSRRLDKSLETHGRLHDACGRLNRYFEQQAKENPKLLPAMAWESLSGPPRLMTTEFAKKYYKVPQSVLGFKVVIYKPRLGELPTDKPEDLVFAPEKVKKTAAERQP